MSDIAIRVENIGKLYHIGVAQRHDTLRDALVDVVPRIMRHNKSSGSRHAEHEDTIWALRDVSFEVQKGEVLGVIGRNGAGKSTLLKILSRITEPTEGRIELNGRVGSLLEVGTGFHPELTGRENVYLNGAILGMKRAEINRKFDEIVAFAEIERFLDTPVKRYSSGMYVRLAFAVAAHLEPEILLVDEVLAVGDAQFQKKCLGKMGDVAQQGRTVLFVSHNMASVIGLCSRAMFLAQGQMIETGATEEIVHSYIRFMGRESSGTLASNNSRSGDGRIRFTDCVIRDAAGNPLHRPMSGQDVTFELKYESAVDACRLRNVSFSIGFFSYLGQPLFLCRSDIQGTTFDDLLSKGSVFCRIPRFPLPPGEFRVNVQSEASGVVLDWIVDAFSLEVQEGDFYSSGRLPSRSRGDLLVEHTWK